MHPESFQSSSRSYSYTCVQWYTTVMYLAWPPQIGCTKSGSCLQCIMLLYVSYIVRLSHVKAPH